MQIVDAGTNGILPTDIIDAGNTSTPPTDFYDSALLLAPQVTSGMITPVFTEVSSTASVDSGPRQVLNVRVGGTATTVTIQIPGTQPYTNLPRDNQTTGSISNAERFFYLAPNILADSTGSIVVLYSQTTGVTSALTQVG